MGLCKLKVQIKNGPKDSVREREKDHAVKKNIFTDFQKEKKSCVKKIFDSLSL
jgi:hypothetical protein